MNKAVKQFRVRWKRVGCKERYRLYWLKGAAQRLNYLLGPEPWKARGKNPDEFMCCDGYNCHCRGRTWKQHMLDMSRAEWPPLEYVVFESRHVTLGDWEQKQ